MYSIELFLTEAQKKWSEERIAQKKKGIKRHRSTAAGVKTKVAKKKLKHDMYRNTLINHNDQFVTQKILRSYNHTVSNVTQHRIGLTAYDDKRYILNDGISTRAHGHYRNSL